MPYLLSKAEQDNFLKRFRLGESKTNDIAYKAAKVIKTDVLIAGSGPIGCTYARTILDKRPSTDIVLAEIGSQDNPIIGGHHKNSIKYQKDFDAFVNIIKGALQPVSVPPGNSFSPTLARAAWAAPAGKPLVSYGNNPLQKPERNLSGTCITRTVGGMASHWTCACPVPHVDERKILHEVIPQNEIEKLFESASVLLGVRSDQFDDSIRHCVVKDILEKNFKERGVKGIPLAVKRRSDNPDYLTWSACDTILGEHAEKVKLYTATANSATRPQFELHTETRVTRLRFNLYTRKIDGAILRDLNTNEDILVIAKVFVIACGAVPTPQILWNSSIHHPALGRYLSDQSLTFCQIVLKREIIDSIRENTNPEWIERIKAHKEKYPDDPLPIPFRDPEPQMMIPYHSDFPWHVQIQRDAFSYGEINFKADPRVVVDLRFFGKSDIVKDNKVTFAPLVNQLGHWEPGIKDLYGMPQATFEFTRTDDDGDRDQRMMKEMTDAANLLGGFLPGAYPQFMELGITSHMTGTTRIGNDPEESIANAESRVHGIDNLWVGGNNCIPDATASNPTLTSMAIAIKGANASVTYLNLPSGAYFISSVAHDRSVGRPSDLLTKQPIVVSDRQIWNVEYLKNGLYRLTLNKFAATAEDNLVYSELNSSETEWLIEQKADDKYTIITSKDEAKGWTLNNKAVSTQVSLEAVPSQIDPKQLWSFTPAFPSGAYFISSVADNELFASHPPDASTKLPVVISKIPVLWNVEHLKNGLYSFTLNNCAATAEYNLVVTELSTGGDGWLIKQRAHGVNEYNIITSKEGNFKGWTLEDKAVGTQVSLEAVPPQIDSKQLWSFIPAYLHMPSGAYFISSVAHNQFVGHPPILPTKLPVVISESRLIWNVEYLENGLYLLTLNKFATTAENNLVWSDLDSIGEKWLIKERAHGVNEYTISKEDKGWTLHVEPEDKALGITQVSLEVVPATKPIPPQHLWRFTPAD